MNNAFKQIAYTLTGTVLGIGVIGYVAAVWVEHKARQISDSVDQKVSDVVNAPAKAVTELRKAANQRANDFNTWADETAKEAGVHDEVTEMCRGACDVIDFIFGSGD